MAEFGFWDVLNVMWRLIAAAVVIVKLTRFYDHYKPEERIGLGVLGGCALMTVPVLVEGPHSPFAGWASSMFAFGVAVYLVGRLRRAVHHARANAEQVRRAKERRRA